MILDFFKIVGNFSTIEKIRYAAFKPLLLLFTILFFAGFFIVFKFTPKDYLQGESAKIMYLHVPAAWACSIIYLIMTILSLLFLIYKNQFFALLAYAFAKTGLLFNMICITTGMIWAKLTWGIYWAWDARLTSVLVLMLFYIFYIFIFKSDEKSYNSMRIASITNIIGAINLPIIKFSVQLLNSVHQPASIIRKNGVAIDFTMFYPLLIFFGAFIFFTAATTIINLHSLMLEKKINRLVMNKII